MPYLFYSKVLGFFSFNYILHLSKQMEVSFSDPLKMKNLNESCLNKQNSKYSLLTISTTKDFLIQLYSKIERFGIVLYFI